MNKRKFVDNESKNGFLKRAKSPEEELVKDNVIRYYLIPSLEHFSAIKIIIALWNRKDIQDKIKKIFTRRPINCQMCKRFDNYLELSVLCQKVKNKVFNRILEVSEFDVIRKILSDLVNPTGQEIFDWIQYQDKNVFYISHCIYQNIAIKYLDCIIWTSRGIIDYEQTAKAVLAKDGLHDVEKYHLACTYCFEDVMAVIAPKLIHRIRYFTSSNCSDQKTMVYFWSAHLTRNFTRLNEEVLSYNITYRTNYGINECMFSILASNYRNNQGAIKFMWNMLSDDEKSRQIRTVVKYSKMDLKCFFLSQMNEAQQHQVFITESKNMMLCLLDHWLWKDYFLPTMHYIRDVIPALDFFLVVENIVECRMVKHYENIDRYVQYKAILKELWQSASIDIKDYIFELENGTRWSGIIFSLLCERNIDMIKLMLHDMSEEQKKTMMFSSPSNFHKCYSLIIKDQTDVVKYIIDNTLCTDSFVDMFKRMLVESYGCSYGHDVAVHFGRNQEYSKIEGFIDWIFKSSDDKKQFKENLAHSEISAAILDLIVADGKEENFKLLEHFFNWCTHDNQNVFRYKKELYEVYFTKVICKFTEREMYELLDLFFYWCFSDSGHKVKLVKHTYHENHNSIQLIQLVNYLVEKNDHLQSLVEFGEWCFAEKRKIARFKKWILEFNTTEQVGVCIELLCKDMFDLADELVSWCCNSSEIKISKFKRELMFYDKVELLFSKNKQNQIKVMKWLNPSAKVIIQSRRRFTDSNLLKDNDIAVLFMKNGKWEEVDQFIEFKFTSDTDKNEFKEKLAYSEICDDNLNDIIQGIKIDFVNLDNFFSWCASGKADRVVELKGEMYQRYFTKVICKLVKDDKYQLLERFTKWCYRNENLRVELLKLYFYGYRKYSEVVQLALDLVEKNDQLHSLKKFVSWCFTKDEEIARFKRLILEPGTEDTVCVCIKLLEKRLFERADEFVCWCCDSSQIKVRRFKNKLMLHEGIKHFFNRCTYEKNTLDKIVKWFEPSFEVQLLFRKMFQDLWWVKMKCL